MAGGAIFHYGAVRLRIVGSGELDMEFIGLDPADTSSLVAITMENPAARAPKRLSNYIGQRARLKVSTDVINEWFRINTISIFVKELWQEYPG